MTAALDGLIAELKHAVRFEELRKASGTGNYLEGVLLRPDLARCYDLLVKWFGPPLKAFGQPPAFTPDIQKIVDAVGGVRANQCLFLAQEGARPIAYAALWPWESNPTRLTLKVGACPSP